MAQKNPAAPQDPSTLKIQAPKIVEETIRRPMSGKTIVAIIFFGLFTIGGFVGILSFVKGEKERTLRDWQIQMGLVVETRAAAVEGWLASQFDVLRGIAANESQKIYIDTLLNDQAPADKKEGAEGFLRNYLKRVAEQERIFHAAPRVGDQCQCGPRGDRRHCSFGALGSSTGRERISTCFERGRLFWMC